MNLKNRYFSLNLTASLYHESLKKYEKAKYAVFTDMVESSMLDIIVVSDSGPEETYS